MLGEYEDAFSIRILPMMSVCWYVCVQFVTNWLEVVEVKCNEGERWFVTRWATVGAVGVSAAVK